VSKVTFFADQSATAGHSISVGGVGGFAKMVSVLMARQIMPYVHNVKALQLFPENLEQMPEK
jgi:hypothetical protein